MADQPDVLHVVTNDGVEAVPITHEALVEWFVLGAEDADLELLILTRDVALTALGERGYLRASLEALRIVRQRYGHLWPTDGVAYINADIARQQARLDQLP